MGTQILAIENGEVDWVGSVPGPDIERVKANRDLAPPPFPVDPAAATAP